MVLSRGVYDRWLATGATVNDPFKIKYGDRVEEFHSDLDDVDVACGAYRDQGDGPRILAGPATSSAAIMPFGLEYTITYELGFGYIAGIEDLCERLPGRRVRKGPADRNRAAPR